MPHRPLLLAFLLPACATRGHVGLARNTSTPDSEDILQVAVHEDFALLGVAARGQTGRDYASFAFGPEVAFPPGVLGPQPQPFSPHLALGVHALQYDWQDNTRTFGAGSPFAQAGMHVCRGRDGSDLIDCIGLSVDAAHHIRFHADNETFVGLSLVVSRWDDPTVSNKKRKRKKQGRR